MHVFSAELELSLPSRSLKAKRGIVKSILARSRQKFNVAAAEVDLPDRTDTAVLGFSSVSGSRMLARKQLEQLEEWLYEEHPDIEIVSAVLEER